MGALKVFAGSFKAIFKSLFCKAPCFEASEPPVYKTVVKRSPAFRFANVFRSENRAHKVLPFEDFDTSAHVGLITSRAAAQRIPETLNIVVDVAPEDSTQNTI